MNRQRNRVLMILENCSYLRDARVSKEARALTRNGYEVSVISPEFGRWPSRLQIEGVTVYGFPKSHLVLIRHSQGIFWNTPTPHSLLPSSQRMYGLPGALTLFISRIHPTVWFRSPQFIRYWANESFTISTILSPELYVARFSRSSAVLLRLQLWLELLSYKLADHVIVTNESYRDVAMSRGRQPETKVTVVRNGPELERDSSTASR
jgi:glycosyltransferase involved in cell wall biosynthesis